MSEHLKQFHGGADRICCVHWRLSDLSAAFRRVGNEGVAAELYALSDQLTEGLTAMDDAFAEEINRSFRQAQQHSATVLEAVLAGVFVGKEGKG